jgi:hypothetical protein
MSEQLLPDKNGTCVSFRVEEWIASSVNWHIIIPITRLVAPVIIHCASGRRAVKAEQVLKSKGYTKVYNAGGLSDMPPSSD